MGAITAWSFSRYNTWKRCPLKAKLKFVDKLPEPGSPAMDRGSEIDKKTEDYLTGKLDVMPPEIMPLKAAYEALRALKPICQQELAFNKSWAPVSWFAKDAWLRVKMDALVPPRVDAKLPTVTVIDNKTGGIDKRTGRFKGVPESYESQLELYGTAGLIVQPVAEQAIVQLYWSDAGLITPKPGEEVSFPKVALPKLKKKWERNVKPMLTDERFSPKEGSDCRWCHFRKSNGGPCPLEN